MGVGMEKPFVHVTHIHANHMIIKNEGGRLHILGDGRLLERVWYLQTCTYVRKDQA